MKLNDSQIEDLYAFTRKHYVEYYDLQTELVDHLANAIEDQWELKPHLSFEDALQIEFKKFGVFGFMEVVEERQKVLSKKYSKLIWKHLKEYFKLPKIILLISLTVGLYYLIELAIVDRSVLTILLALSLIAYVVDAIIHIKINKAKKNSGEKKWMFEEIIRQYGSGLWLFFVPIQGINILNLSGVDFVENSPVFIAVFSFVFVLLLMTCYIIQFEIPKKAEQYLEETYPEYKLV
ncbi:hypothetical protein [Nonlabens ulvanivorans]|uniref:Uncharacterized protein n=1 Tax=Nonlabens ulvanivorans TaxID=906888 RepID=A0A084JWV6_NONUL|nr:hypothetical protein [Nonlabens ulvanivorans]KEZ93440.1 hypothetical protein IL45_04260 [Nonlabens ulvanivorans]PRX14026.1 hypothetical protein LY02_01055 [Nonlabens ulvanivorans]